MAFSEALKTKLKRKLSNKSRTTIQLEGYSSITKFQCGISSSEGGGKTLQVQVSTCTEEHYWFEIIGHVSAMKPLCDGLDICLTNILKEELIDQCYICIKLSGYDSKRFKKFPSATQLSEYLTQHGWHLTEESQHKAVIFQSWSNKNTSYENQLAKT